MRDQRDEDGQDEGISWDISSWGKLWHVSPLDWSTNELATSSTMPTFLAVENEGPQEQASLEDYFVEYESQNQRFKDHLSFLMFQNFHE